MPEFTSPFATANTSAEDVAALIAQGLDHMRPNGDIDWAELDTPIGYSRGWLIVRRAYLEQHNPKALVKLPDAKPGESEDAHKYRQHQVVVAMREEQQLSWGEISVRLGVPESRVRAMYRHNGVKKDLGLRIGKGGRFAYDDPVLYLDNRKKEGAYIPLTKKGRPQAEELLNFIAKGEERARRTRDRAQGTADEAAANRKFMASMRRKITLLERKAADKACTPEEREAFLAKAAELRAKHNIAA